jgi:alkanesulfonate monooxygenase SsuD/methylene tetrahydromethanopterin reductase-like flavin-dependent oxidoreductase (luciferase family)
MKIGVGLPTAEVDGVTPLWTEVRDFALAVEQMGMDSVWVWDHFYYDPEDGSPVEGQHEAWTILSALAAVTERVEVGTLVLCSNFREPGLVAKMAATLDEVSGGRLVLGLGAGWHDPEYDAFGFPKDHRVDRFEEALQIVSPLLDGRHVTFEGNYYTARDAFLTPAPRRRIPLLIACEGPRMLGLTARHARSWNTAWYGAPDDRLREMFAAMDAAMVAVARDPSEMAKTVGVTVRDPDAASTGEEPSLAGSVEDLARAFDEYEALGAAHLICGLEPTNEGSLVRLRAAMDLRRGK